MLANNLVDSVNELKFLDKNSIKQVSAIYSPRVGIVNAILKRHELDKYGLYMYQSLSANITVLFSKSREVSSGGLGVDFSEKNAFWACIGETIERYCMSFYDPKGFLFEKWENLPKNPCPKSFDLYSDTQYKLEKSFSNPKKEYIHWVKLFGYKNKKILYWPASMIYLPFDEGKPVAEITSTGVSAARNIEECIRKSILEIIERDAVMINFTMHIPPFLIDIKTINSNPLADFIKKVRKIYHIKIFKLQYDLNIPVYLCLIWRGKEKLHYGIGACAELNSDSAILKALKECLFTYFYSNSFLDLRQKDPDKIKALYEHFLYYQDKDFFKLFSNASPSKYRRHSITYTNLLKEIRANNLEIYYKDLTTQDVEKTGIKVARVVIPGMIDLNKTHRLIRKNAKRFKEVPKKLGFKKVFFSKLPHPFP